MTERIPNSTAKRLLRCWPWFAAALSGGLLALCFPPADVGGLAFVALIPLLCGVWLGRPWRRVGLFRFGLGYVTGLVFFTATFSWLAELGPLYQSTTLRGLPLLLGSYLALYPAAWAWFAGWIAGEHFKPLPPPDPLAPFERPVLLLSSRNLGIAVLLSSAWVGLEWVRGWMLSGFGWNTLGVALHADLPLIQIVEFTGVGGLSFLLVMCNAIGLITVLRLRAEIGRVRLRPHFDFAVAVALVALTFGYGARILIRERESAKETTMLRVAAVQPNIPQRWKFDIERSEEILARMQELTDLAVLTSPDLLLWPEASVPGGMERNQDTKQFVREQAASVPAMMIGTDDINRFSLGDDHNSAALLLAGKADAQFYDKRHLVPFGEFLPLRPLLGPVVGELVPGDFKPGVTVGVFSLERPAVKLAPLVCFEDTLGEIAREPVHLGARVLVNLTNDGWFGHSCEPQQHFANAVFRAVENRIPLVRCTNTGVTASVDPLGRVDRWIEPFSVGIASRRLSVPLRTAQTFYTRNGEVFSVACAVLAAVSLMARWRISAGQK